MGRDAGAMHSDRVIRAIAGSAPASSALAASWRRSGALHALDPASPSRAMRLEAAGVAAARDKLGRLLHIAQSSLDRLFLAVGGVGCSVLLADGAGVVLDRRGAPSDDATFDEWGLWTGAVWSERSEGTNGIGTCLVESRAVTIDRDEHFFDRNTLLACMTAPIFDECGELAAALDVSSCRADLTEGFVKLIGAAVADAARAIEAENFRLAFPEARIVLAPEGDRAGPALIAVDRDDLVVGATRAARLVLGVTTEMLARPRPAADLIGVRGPERDGIEAAERAALQRALARAGETSRGLRGT